MLHTLLASTLGLLSAGNIWNGHLKTDPQSQVWWHSPYDGTFHYPECESEFKANQSGTEFKIEKLGIHCTKGPYWNFEQELPPMNFELKGIELFWNNDLVGRVGQQTLRVEFTDEWNDQHYIFVRNFIEDNKYVHYLNWSVNSSDYISFDMESNNLRDKLLRE